NKECCISFHESLRRCPPRRAYTPANFARRRFISNGHAVGRKPASSRLSHQLARPQAVTQRLVFPPVSRQANALSLLSIALGLAIAGAVVPDLLVRTPPDREFIHRNLELVGRVGDELALTPTTKTTLTWAICYPSVFFLQLLCQKADLARRR